MRQARRSDRFHSTGQLFRSLCRLWLATDFVVFGSATDVVVLRSATDFVGRLAAAVVFGFEHPQLLPVIGEHRCWLGVSAEGSGDSQVLFLRLFRGSVDFTR